MKAIDKGRFAPFLKDEEGDGGIAAIANTGNKQQKPNIAKTGPPKLPGKK